MEETTDLLDNPMQEPEFKTIMERIEASNAGQEKYARRQYIMSQITAIASVVILGIVLYAAATILPKLNTTYENLQVIMSDLEVVTSELAEADLDDMITNVNHLVTSSEKNVQDALSQVNSIDVDTLNRAIQNLSDAVEPFANFFNRFR